MTIVTTGQLGFLLSANPCGVESDDPGEVKALANLVKAGLLARDAEGIHRLTEAGHREARQDMGLPPRGPTSDGDPLARPKPPVSL